MPKFESFVKACQSFFSDGEHGKKVDISEFKALTVQDKLDLSEQLNTAGYEHPAYTNAG